jgi:GWxTD domain-containing protein
LLLPAAALAQEQQEKKKEEKQASAKEKEKQKKAKELLKELASPYRKWLEDEVTYIITDEERTAFLRLNTNEEREQFIESFWNVRDPTPDTIENETRDEHYRRIAYANERFASGVPGWRTDRGRIYIIWGEPDEKESYPSGGSYQRPSEEGGGSTSVFPFERWRYRYLEGIGNEVILEFVDPSGSNEYRLTADPSEKDALLHVPGAGLSELEAMGLASKTDRFTRSDGTHLPTTMGAQPMHMNEFERLALYAKVQQPPKNVRFRELQELVVSRIVRNQLQFTWRSDFLRVTGDTVLVPITVQIPNRQMTFKETEGVHTAMLNLFARITTITGRRVQVFEDVIQRDFPETLLKQGLEGFSVYQKAVPLRPGLYRLDIVIKDVESGNVGVINERLAVPQYEENKLASSTLILADQIERVSAKQIGLGQFVLGASKVRPRVNQTFTPEDKLGIYLQVYNLGIDEQTHRPAATIDYRVLRNQKDAPEVLHFTETSDQIENRGEQITLEKMLNLAGLEPGQYKLEIVVNDQVAKQSLTRSAQFTIKAAPKTAAMK